MSKSRRILGRTAWTKGDFARSGQGELLSDVTGGVTRPEDLPKVKVIHRSRNFAQRPCPICGKSCFRNAQASESSMTGAIWLPVVPRHPPRVLATSTYPLSQVLQRGHVRLCLAQSSLHPLRHLLGRATRRGERLALSSRLLASLARSPRFLSPMPPSNTGWRPGGKRRPAKWTRPTSTGPWLISPVTSRPTNYTTVHFASCPSLIIAPSSGSFIRFVITGPNH
jgi:hypothetical protein